MLCKAATNGLFHFSRDLSENVSTLQLLENIGNHFRLHICADRHIRLVLCSPVADERQKSCYKAFVDITAQ
jgi:hypothetical protein